MPGPNFESLRYFGPERDQFRIRIQDGLNKHVNRIIRNEIEAALDLEELSRLQEVSKEKLRLRIEPELDRLRDRLRSFEWQFDLRQPIEIDSEGKEPAKQQLLRTI